MFLGFSFSYNDRQMKPKRALLISLLLALPLALFIGARMAASWKPQVVGNAPGAYELQFSTDGRWLLATMGVGEDSSPIKAFDLTKRVKAHEFDATFAKFSPDSKKILIFDRLSSQLRIVNLQNGKTEQSWSGLTPQKNQYSNEAVDDVQLRDGGRELVAVTPFRIWRLDVQSGAKLSQTKIQIKNYQSPHGYNGQFLLKDGRRLLYVNGDESYIYDVRTGKRVGKAEFGQLSSDEKWLWFYNPEVGQFWIDDFATGKVSWGREFDGQPQFSGDGRALIVIGAKSGVRLLDPRTGKLLRKLNVPTPREDDLFNPAYALSPDNWFWFFRQGDEILRYHLR